MRINRQTEFVLGLIASIFGILTAIIVLNVGETTGNSTISLIGFITLLFSILGLVGACITKKDHLLGGTFMISAALGIAMINISFLNIIPLVLLAIAGLMAMIRGGHFRTLLKKWWFYTLLVATILIPIFGFMPSTANSNDLNDSNVEYNVPIVEFNSPNDVTDTTESDGTSDESTSNDQSYASDIGTQENAVDFNDTFKIEGPVTKYNTMSSIDASTNLTVTETIRGDEAWKFIQTRSKYNEAPPEGKEYILNKIKVKVYDIALPEDRAYINASDFTYFSDSNIEYDTHQYIILPDELNAHLYNNEETDGYVVGLIDLDDRPLIEYENFYFATE
ncbi:DUF4064 domain-containing protein [Listeria immobilis]|uniref:DUF4064 domain-containing protein n=2 Tax=Listeria immobilis TaxID=2713502 RepID=A0A7X0X9P0_9LIST|nr:DUF4064 domain-containing protein [Listeria immobilis]MBC1490152.1 hypothetical protein [Listeria immobilis]MBC1516998.1 hypothetical protein [Listeria immobilis]